jgi:hypothetical protein
MSKKNFAIGQVWAAKPNRNSDQIIFEIVGKMLIEGSRYWIAAKHMTAIDLLSKLEVNIVVIDDDGHSVPSNLTLSPPLEWTFTERLKRPRRFN